MNNLGSNNNSQEYIRREIHDSNDFGTMYRDGNNFLTKIPSQGIHARFLPDVEESIKINHNPPLDSYLKYLEDNNLENSKFSELLKEFKTTKLNHNDFRFINYLQYLLDGGKIKGNREFYSHLLKVLDFMESENIIHPELKEHCLTSLSVNFYSENGKNKDGFTSYKHKKIDYSKFYEDTSKKVSNNQVLNELYKGGGELYIDKKGKFFLKLSKYDKPTIDTRKVIEGFLSSHFGYKIKITDEVISYQDFDFSDFISKGNIIGVDDVE